MAKNPKVYTAKRAKIVFGEEMKPCPGCGSYHLGFQTPVRRKGSGEVLDLRKQLAEYAKQRRDGTDLLEGPCYIWCWDCGHNGPPVDCSGRTSTDVGKDPVVAKEIRRLWNSQ